MYLYFVHSSPRTTNHNKRIFISASGLFVASKYPILKAKIHFDPITVDELHTSISSLMLLKIDLGFKKKEKFGDKTIDNQDQFDEAKVLKKRYVGFLTNVSSSQKTNYPIANSKSKLKKKLKPVIEDFKHTTNCHNKMAKNSDRIECPENDGNDERILFSVIAGKMPVTQRQSGKTRTFD